ncbi:MAG: cytochrome c biogenesis protein ResB [Marmoricola sp.]
MTIRDDAPALGPFEFARWIWRQLTSMRTALFLLFLLALAAIPGSVIPQDNVDNILSAQWRTQHKTLAPIYEKLQLFNVYSSAWFSAIYILLLISLVGCVLPRLAVYWRGLRAKPPAAPRNLTRLSAHRSWSGDADVIDRAASLLRRRRFRVEVAADGSSVAAERGYLREAGNLLFHLSVLVVLFGVAASKLYGFQGGVIVVTGNGFSNSLSQYDSFQSGGLFNADSLAPFTFKVSDFKVSYIETGREAGLAHQFDATVRYQTRPGAPAQNANLSVNHPLTIDGTQVYLISHGYAPLITVRDGHGNVVYSGPTVFLPEGQDFRSFGVLKVPDSRYANGKPLQLGLQGEFYPTYYFTMATGPLSLFPRADNPAISMLVYEGDLGLDNGVPQNVYTLDMKHLRPGLASATTPLRLDMMTGDTATLPGGRGSVTFDGVTQFVKLQISRAPDAWVALVGMCLALLGLLGSLFVRPRRLWVRHDPASGSVEIAALDRSSGGDPAPEVEELAQELGMPAVPSQVSPSVEGGA